MSEVLIIDAIRTPIGSFLGQYKKIESVDLGSSCIEGIFNRNKNLNKKHVEGLILGQVLTAGLGMNTARQVSLKSGLSQSSFSYCVNQVCGSGMRAVMDSALKIQSKENQLLIAGGQESMSLARHTSLLRKGIKLGNDEMIDYDVAKDNSDWYWNMGLTAEAVANKWNISRKDQDEFAFNSHQKALNAIEKGYFKSGIVPITVKETYLDKNEKRQERECIVDTDEGPRKGGSAEASRKVKQLVLCTRRNQLTAANASQTSDGAASLLLLMSEKTKYTLKIRS